MSGIGAKSIEECYCDVGYYGVPGSCRPCPKLGRWGEKGAWTHCTRGKAVQVDITLTSG